MSLTNTVDLENFDINDMANVEYEFRQVLNFDHAHNTQLGLFLECCGSPEILDDLEKWVRSGYETRIEISDLDSSLYTALALSLSTAHAGDSKITPDANTLAQCNGNQPVWIYRTDVDDFLSSHVSVAQEAMKILRSIQAVMGEVYQLGLVFIDPRVPMTYVMRYEVIGATKTIWIVDSGEYLNDGCVVCWLGLGPLEFTGDLDASSDSQMHDANSTQAAEDSDSDLSDAMEDVQLEQLAAEIGTMENKAQLAAPKSRPRPKTKSPPAARGEEGEGMSDGSSNSQSNKRVRKLNDGSEVEYEYRVAGTRSAPPPDTDLPLDLMDGITLDEMLIFFPNHCIWPMVAVLMGCTWRKWTHLQKLICFARQTEAEFQTLPLARADTLRQQVSKAVSKVLGCQWFKDTRAPLDWNKFSGNMWVSDSENMLKEPWTLRQIGAAWEGKVCGPPGKGVFRDKVAAALLDARNDRTSDPAARVLANPPRLSPQWADRDETLPFVPPLPEHNKPAPKRTGLSTSLNVFGKRGQVASPDIDQDRLRDLLLDDPEEAMTQHYRELIGETLLSFLTLMTVTQLMNYLWAVLEEANETRTAPEPHTMPDRTTFPHRRVAAMKARARKSGRSIREETQLWNDTERKPQKRSVLRPENSRDGRKGVPHQKKKQRPVPMRGGRGLNEEEEETRSGSDRTSSEGAQSSGYSSSTAPEGYEAAASGSDTYQYDLTDEDDEAEFAALLNAEDGDIDMEGSSQ